MTRLRIGIDIGGTNTDAVLVNEKNELLAFCKAPTKKQVEVGVQQAVLDLMKQSQVSPTAITRVLVGTTHATNAILENSGLYKVGLIRLAGHNPASLPPACSWNQTLREGILRGCRTIGGGYECDGREITPFQEDQVLRAAEQLLEEGAESLAIVGAFSPLNPSQEERAEKTLREAYGPELPISLSHQLGGMGFMERENSCLLNAALKKALTQGFGRLKEGLQNLGMNCPLFLTQNNGSILSLEEALAFPVLTLSAGPTNSFVGASKLAGLRDAVIVDVGGTSTDVGRVVNGFCRRSLGTATIGGVPLNFSMPDVLAVAIGGGSIISPEGRVGPQSLGSRLLKESMSFGGGTCTLTDLAIATEALNISGCQELLLNRDLAEACLKASLQQIQTLVRRMQGAREAVPVLLVGGGAACFAEETLPAGFQHLAFGSVANAYGASMAELTASATTVVSLDRRKEVIEALCEQARRKATDKGAPEANLRVVDIQCLPFHYVPGNLGRLTVTVAGPIGT